MADPGQPTPSTPPEGAEHDRIVTEILEDQKKKREARATATVPTTGPDRPFLIQIALLTLAVFSFYLFFFSPDWVAPAAASPVSPERTEASVRWYLFTVRESVEGYRTEFGQLPGTLSEIPAAKPGTTYDRVTPADYRVGFTEGDLSLTIDSNEDPAAFLGDAAELVLRGVT